MTIILEEITRVGGMSLEKIIEEQKFQFNKLSGSKSYDINFSVMEYFKITFQMIAVKNRNVCKLEYASLRVLETSAVN